MARNSEASHREINGIINTLRTLHPMQPTLRQIVARLDRELRTDQIQDSSLNGLQVGSDHKIGRVALAVDASMDTIAAAAEKAADLLIVHHGLFWGQESRLTGALYQKINLLMTNHLALYASHLPLDLHPKFGNNALLSKALRLRTYKPFGQYHHETIGFGGRLPSSQTCADLGKSLERVTGTAVRIFPFGQKRIQNVAIVSGGGGDMALEAAQCGYDAFITGEITHPVYHIAKENRLNLITGGHYATETLGVKALGRFLERIFQIKCFFLDFPTGL